MYGLQGIKHNSSVYGISLVFKMFDRTCTGTQKGYSSVVIMSYYPLSYESDFSLHITIHLGLFLFPIF
jgi:hypothetical protein